MPATDPARLQTLLRLRLGLAAATLLVPLGCAGLGGRNAGRLDGLAERGVRAEALVTAISDGGTFYRYEAGGAVHEWNVKRADAPYDLGARFPVTVLPEVPSFSRPGTDRAAFADQAASTRRFVGALAVGVFAAGLGLLALVQRDLQRARSGTPPAPVTLESYRRRLRWTGAALAVPVAGITAFHALDAQKDGESLIPVALGLGLALVIVGGILGRGYQVGPAAAGAWAAKLGRWVVPLAVAVAALRLLVALLGG